MALGGIAAGFAARAADLRLGAGFARFEAPVRRPVGLRAAGLRPVERRVLERFRVAMT
jgi:hypothetical protein